MKRIEVRIGCNEVSTTTLDGFFNGVQGKLEAAGIRFKDGNPVGGTISRRDDPENFGQSVWVFTPHVS